jgi:hypothetical protein
LAVFLLMRVRGFACSNGREDYQPSCRRREDHCQMFAHNECSLLGSARPLQALVRDVFASPLTGPKKLYSIELLHGAAALLDRLSKIIGGQSRR